jgi:phosphatidylglycerophosphatase A
MPAMRGDPATEVDTSLGARVAVWIATGLGVGLVSPAPGTVAGLWGLLLVPAVHWLPTVGLQAAAIAVLILAAVAVCGAASRALISHGDPGAVALDEIVALPIVFLGVPRVTWPILIVGYVLFRVCDVLKPGLAREAEKLPGGWGVVADDVVAAALAWAALRGSMWLDGAAHLNWLTSAG